MFLIILTGMPCSGKTELATLLAKKLENHHNIPTVVVDPDKIRGMIPALKERFDPERESLIEHLALVLIDESLRKKNLVISDDMNYYESTRHRLVQIAKKHEAKYMIVYMVVSLEKAKARNVARESPIPEELISKVAQNFDTPGAKYKWDRPSLTIDTENTGSEEAANSVLELVLLRLKEKSTESSHRISKARSGCNQKMAITSKFKRTLDESTRTILNESFSSGKLNAALSGQASAMRKAFVNEMSKRSITIKDAEREFRKRVKELSLRD
jgi:tRNA uridine 5-carbamoylmethylation protein Kti12